MTVYLCLSTEITRSLWNTKSWTRRFYSVNFLFRSSLRMLIWKYRVPSLLLPSGLMKASIIMSLIRQLQTECKHLNNSCVQSIFHIYFIDRDLNSKRPRKAFFVCRAQRIAFFNEWSKIVTKEPPARQPLAKDEKNNGYPCNLSQVTASVERAITKSRFENFSYKTRSST